MPDRSLDDILAEAEDPAYVRVATVKVLLRQDLVTRHAQLEGELAAAIARDAKTNDPDRAPDIAQQIDDLQGEMEAAKVEFRFRNIGRKAWADLLAAHPPEKQHKELKTDHNPETFPIAAIAASCSEPAGVDEGAVRRLEAALTDSQFTSLWRACIDANLGGVDVPKSLVAGRILQVNGRSANTAVLEASHVLSS